MDTTMSNDDPSVVVAVRLRPLNEKEKCDEKAVSSTWYRNESKICPPKKIKTPHFEFEHVFGQESRTEQIYKEIVSPMVSKCFEGYNSTVLFYGESGSGKSYTLFGHGTEEDGGMMYFATMEIMKRLCDESRTYHIRIGLFDLLNGEVTNIVTKEGAPSPPGFVQIPAFTANEFYQAMNDILRARKIREIKLDRGRKFATTVLSIVIESVPTDGNEDATVTGGVIRFVDLASSGEPDIASAVEQRFKEVRDSRGDNTGMEIVPRKMVSSYSAAQSEIFKNKYSGENGRLLRLKVMLKTNVNDSSFVSLICTVSATAVLKPLATLTFASSLKNISLQPIRNFYVSPEAECQAMAQQWEKQLMSKISEVTRTQKQLQAIYKFYKPRKISQVSAVDQQPGVHDSDDPLSTLEIPGEIRTHPVMDLKKRLETAVKVALAGTRQQSVSSDEGVDLVPATDTDELARKEKELQKEIDSLRVNLNEAHQSRESVEEEFRELKKEAEDLNAKLAQAQDRIQIQKKENQHLLGRNLRLESERITHIQHLRKLLGFCQQAAILYTSIESALEEPSEIVVSQPSVVEQSQSSESTSSRGSSEGPGDHYSSSEYEATHEGIAAASGENQLRLTRGTQKRIKAEPEGMHKEESVKKKRKRDPEPPANCPECGMQLSGKWSVRGHLKRIHKWKPSDAEKWLPHVLSTIEEVD